MSTIMVQINERTPPSVPAGQQLQLSFKQFRAQQEAQQAAQKQAENPAGATNEGAAQQPPRPDEMPEFASREELNAAVREMSTDLVNKAKQLETLIKALPGHGVSEKEQWEKMRALEQELRDLEGEREEAVREREELMAKVEDKIMGVGGI
jgi:mediator of RNA polymerase II transcription subunit 21